MLAALKIQLTQAIKSNDVILKDVIRVILGEANTLEARSGKALTDEQVQAIVRKLILANTETLSMLTTQNMQNHVNFGKLTAENVFLQTLLPVTLSIDEIVSKLSLLTTELKQAKSDGQATGIAVKSLKQQGLTATGADVGAAVKIIRG